MVKRAWDSMAADRKMLLELRRLYDRDSTALARAFDQFRRAYERLPAHERRGIEAINDPEARYVAEVEAIRRRIERVLPPVKIVRGKAVTVDRRTLALLLADYNIREILAGNKTVKRKDWLVANAERGLRHGTPYSAGVWRNVDTIETYLKEAEQLAKSDQGFAREAAEWAALLLEIGGSRT